MAKSRMATIYHTLYDYTRYYAAKTAEAASYLGFSSTKITDEKALTPLAATTYQASEKLSFPDFLLKSIHTHPLVLNGKDYSNYVLSFHAQYENELYDKTKILLQNLFNDMNFDPIALENLISIIQADVSNLSKVLEEHSNHIENFKQVQDVFKKEFVHAALTALYMQLVQFKVNTGTMIDDELNQLLLFIVNAKKFNHVLEQASQHIPEFRTVTDAALYDQVNEAILALETDKNVMKIKLKEKKDQYNKKMIISQNSQDFKDNLNRKKICLEEFLALAEQYNDKKHGGDQLDTSSYRQQYQWLVKFIGFYNTLIEGDAHLHFLQTKFIINSFFSEKKIQVIKQQFQCKCDQFNECMNTLINNLTDASRAFNGLSFIDREVLGGNVATRRTNNDAGCVFAVQLDKMKQLFFNTKNSFTQQLQSMDKNNFYPVQVDGVYFDKIKTKFMLSNVFLRLKEYYREKSNSDPKKKEIKKFITRIQNAENLDQLLLAVSRNYVNGIMPSPDHLESKSIHPFSNLVRHSKDGNGHSFGLNLFKIAHHGFKSSTHEFLYQLEEKLIKITNKMGMNILPCSDEVKAKIRLT